MSETEKKVESEPVDEGRFLTFTHGGHEFAIPAEHVLFAENNADMSLTSRNAKLLGSFAADGDNVAMDSFVRFMRDDVVRTQRSDTCNVVALRYAGEVAVFTVDRVNGVKILPKNPTGIGISINLAQQGLTFGGLRPLMVGMT